MSRALRSVRQRIRDLPDAWWVLTIAVAGLAIGVPQLIDSLRFTAAGHHTTGVIVEVQAVDQDDLYRPIVEFTSPDGRQLRFVSRQTAGTRSYYQVGQSVGVLYTPGNPADARLDTWESAWASEAIVPALSVLLLVLGIHGVQRNRRGQGPHVNQRRFTASPPNVRRADHRGEKQIRSATL
ncbi:MAG TPA: DUF3592 domain-containing protein [Candidatus Limnocylindrales bacterium]|nr:DUF3592 domain-containing protein [Candidatus Limnocylindrales bacterium]